MALIVCHGQPDGNLWWVLGCDHMGGQTAGLFSFDGAASKCYSQIDGMRSGDPAGDQVQTRLNWGLRPTSFGGLMFTKGAALLVASSDYGIMKFQGGKWEHMTKDWTKSVSVCGLEVTDSDVAVLPVYELGIVLYNLKTEKYSFILPDYCAGKQVVRPKRH